MYTKYTIVKPMATFMEDYLSGLNDRQTEAVLLNGQSALVLAGAGTGKTRVLTTRIVHLISHHQVDPSNILAVTFTNKAALEMYQRISSHFPKDPNLKRLWVGTFHGICNRILRDNYKAAGLSKNYHIMDEADQLAAIKRVLKRDGFSGPSEELALLSRKMQSFINQCKEGGIRPDNVAKTWDIRDGLAFDEWIRIYTAYESACDVEGAIDFSEIILRTCDLLFGRTDIQSNYQDRFTHVLVDEFQDTNALQYAWLRLLTTDQTNIFAVGDDDQSIYAFRGAKVENMQTFKNQVAHGTVIRLEQNYRSTPPILGLANAIICNNNERLGKTLWTNAESGELTCVDEYPDGLAESSNVVSKIQTLIRGGAQPKDVAILYRTNAQSQSFEKNLISAGIPYAIHGGLRFFDRQEIKNAIAFLKLIDNMADDGAFLRIVNFPPRKLGEKAVESLEEVVKTLGVPIFEAAAGSNNAHFQAFVELIERLREATSKLTLSDAVNETLKLTGMLDYYRDREEEERLENLHQLVTTAQQFSSAQEEIDDRPATLNDFLTNATIGANDEHANVSRDNCVKLMTIHAAKGLEFDYVFLVGMEENLFPYKLAVEEGSLDEERRLLYVAVTRAKKQLRVSHAEERMLYGKLSQCKPSQFIAEFPDEFVFKRHSKPSFGVRKFG